MASCALDEYLAALQISSSENSIQKTKFILVDDNMKATPNDYLRASKLRSSRGLSRTHSLPSVSQRWTNTTENEIDDQSNLHPSQTSHQVLKRCRWDDFTSDYTSDGTRKSMNIITHHKDGPLPSRRSHDQFVSLPIRSTEDNLAYGRVSTTDSRSQDRRRRESHGQDTKELVATSPNLAVVREGRNHHQQQPAFRKAISLSSSGRSLSHCP